MQATTLLKSKGTTSVLRKLCVVSNLLNYAYIGDASHKYNKTCFEGFPRELHKLVKSAPTQ